MNEIGEFITARLDEEERDARAATPGPWDTRAYDMPEVIFATAKGERTGSDVLIYDEGGHTEADARHIVRQDPAATLGRVEALRALVAHASRPERAYGDDPVAGAVNEDRETTLRYVAAFYRLQSDGTVHPDYREEWKL